MKLINLKDIDILSALNEKTGESTFKTKSGLPDILENFKYIAKESGIKEYIKDIYIEYSTASLMLSENKMVGFACVDSEDEDFKCAVKNYSPIVINFIRTSGISLYYHKDMLSCKSANTQAGKPFISSFYSKTEEEQEEVWKGLQIDPASLSQTLKNSSGSTSSCAPGTLFWPITYDQTIYQLNDFVNKFKRNDSSIDDLFGCVHYCYDLCFYHRKTLPENYKTIYFGIPTIGTSTPNNSLNGQGGIFVYFSYDSSRIENKLLGFINEVSASFDYIIKSYTYNLLSSVTFDFWKKAEREAIKSAKAAIMARNMSHNLGSHVMFYIKQKLDNAKKIYDTDVLEYICKGGDFDLTADRVQELKNKKIELPFLVGLGRFMNYLQERQDYIATIATDYIPANSTISFKDFIYDELKPDLRYKRHKETGSSPTETEGTKPKNLLMEYIALSEGYDKSDKIVLKFGAFTGDNPELEPKNEHNIRPYKPGTPELKSMEGLRDFNVALPGGVIGRQAFFSIMENIIRNAAKHSGHRKDGNIEIDLDIIDPEKATWKNIRTKNCTGEQLLKLYRNKSDDYFILAITDNMPHSKAAVDRIIELLDDPYVDENNQMKDTNKGLKEIRLSAAWLRRYQLDTEIDTTKEPPVISIQEIPFDETSFAIRYYICLSKPKRVAFLLDKDFSCNNSISDVLRKKGCGLFSGKEAWQNSSIADYDLVVLCTDVPEEHLMNISSRYLPYNEQNIETFKTLVPLLRTGNAEQAVNDTVAAYFKCWYESIANSSPHNLSILDEKAKFKHQEERTRGILLGTTTTVDKDYYNKAIVFSTHFSGMSSKTLPMQQLYAQAAFVEGITGNNSTDRLIRQTDWTEEWKYKHLAAGLLRVAIFDERIFSTISPMKKRGEASLSSDSISKFANHFWQNNVAPTVDDLYDAFSAEYSAKISDNNIIKSIFNHFGEALPSKEDFIKQVVQSTSGLKDDIYDINKTQLYYERRIWAYDIKVSDNSNIDIIGYNAPIEESVGVFEPQKHNVTHVGTLTKKDNGYVLAMSEISQAKHKFDFISIHQGILDKIYNFFGINNISNAQERENEKLKITYAIFNELSVKAKENKFKETDEFLPQMIIHSGRSKPNSSDMPQKLPFVQFAAIDHAVRDCKYTLSELLYSAHYEEN